MGLDVAVVVVAIFEVGRTGTISEDFGEDDEVVEVEVAGHATGPQARSVGQHPPPRLEGQDRKPGEQERAVGELEKDSVVDNVSREVEEIVVDEGDVDDDDDGGGVDDDTGIIGVMSITGDRVCV